MERMRRPVDKLVSRLTRRQNVRQETSQNGAPGPSKEISHGFQQVYPAPNSKGRDETTIDIIAIHGLDTSAPATWQYKPGEDGTAINWLSDENMLPASVPNARILTYNWHADYSKASVDLTLRDHASSFLLDLRAARQKALSIAASAAGQDYSFLRHATVGVVFLGTPFKGSLAQRLAQLLLAYQGWTGERGSDTLLRDLDASTGVLNDLVDQFMREAHGTRYYLPLHCFFETKPTNLSKKVLPKALATLVRLDRIIVEPESACLEGWDKTPLDCNHTMMNKFKPNSEEFRRVASIIHKFVSEAKDTSKQRQTIQDDVFSDKAYSFMVPFGRNKSFVGRSIILGQLLSKISPGSDKEDCQRTLTILEGLGGVGKTQIALEAVYRVREKDPECAIYWVPLVNQSMFEQAYRQIGQKLGVCGINDNGADVKLLVKAALEGSTSKWLLVMDNIDDSELLFGGTNSNISDRSLAQYFPFNERGSILFTTRNHEVAVGLATSVEDIITVEEMDSEDALKLLKTNLKPEQVGGDATILADLLEFLCNLPLAIRQASAYMAKKQLTATKYLEFCRSSDKGMVAILSKDFEDRYRYKEIQNPVATTWLVSFQQILVQDPLAAKILKYMCFLAEKDILQFLLPKSDEIGMLEAIGTLKAYAFIMERDEPDIYDIHRLVRMSMLNWTMEQGELSESKTCVIQGLSERFPFPRSFDDNMKIWKRYLPHVEYALEVNGEANDTLAEGVLCGQLGLCYWHLFNLPAAEKILKRSIGILQGTVGWDHEMTLGSRETLAQVLCRMGKDEEGIQILKQILDTKKRTVGAENEMALSTMRRMASALDHATRYEEAVEINRQVVKIEERIYGERGKDTLVDKNLLASCLSRAGKLEEADVMLRQLLKDFRETLGEEDIETLACMRRLARNLEYQGKNSEAEVLIRQAVEATNKAYSEENYRTVLIMDQLARILDKQEKYEESESMFREMLELSERVLGREHWETIIAMAGLANALFAQGKFEQAEQFYREALERMEDLFVRNHTNVQFIKGKLIRCLEHIGKSEEADEIRKTMP